MELYEWGIDVNSVTETQLRDRVDACDKYRMIGKGRSKCGKRCGGVGLLIRNNLILEIDEMNVGNCMMSEDILTRRVEYKVGKKVVSQIMVVRYMTIQQALMLIMKIKESMRL